MPAQVDVSASHDDAGKSALSGAREQDPLVEQTRVNCVPGDCVCAADELTVSGPGTYERSGFIRACRAGQVCVRRDAAGDSANVRRRIVVSVVAAGDRTSSSDCLPSPGALVTCRVLSVTARACRCDILCVHETTLRHALRGLLRCEDVRATHRDSVRLHECYRAGDVILARVLAMADTTSYLLSTAAAELGVALARSDSGGRRVWMVPLSWTEMVCPVTQARQLRKVAKIPPEDVVRRILAMSAENGLVS